jgi:meiotic recombination protein SPO11
VTERDFTASAQARKAAIMTRVMGIVHEVVRRGIHTTKRDLFYSDVKLFRQQDESDAVLDDVACLIGCPPTSLHVEATEKGVVVGRLRFREAGDLIDCARMGVGGKAIPPFIDRITDMTSDAAFILLVEKDAAFMRLAEDRFYNKYPCIIITAKGQPDVATRLFLRKCRQELGLPVLGLVDSDPYGLKILSVYLSGSKTMSYDSASLTTPDIFWLGVRPSDLDKYDIPDQCRLKMTDADVKVGKDLLKEEFIKSNPAWHAELEHMLRRREKAEIQALYSYGFQYLSEEFLPRKLREGDWI